MIEYVQIFPCFRSLWASALQIFAMISMILQPLTANCFHTKFGSGNRQWESDPPRSFEELDPETGDVLSATPNTWWEADSDADNLTNDEEVLFGSDPYGIDPDGDGLTDKDERDFSMSDPWLWDSDGDGYTDYDEYYAALRASPPTLVNYGLLMATGYYFSLKDADGDGINNLDDPFPIRMDNDLDGISNWQDSTPNGAVIYGYWFGGIWYPDIWSDMDSDGIPDLADSSPVGEYVWRGTTYPLPKVDSDSDGIPDFDDHFEGVNGQHNWGDELHVNAWYPGELADNDVDGDGIPNAFDLFRNVQGQIIYQGQYFAGTWETNDNDRDRIPNPVDPYPNPGDQFWYLNAQYVTVTQDNDHDGVPNLLDLHPNIGQGYWYPGTRYDGGTSSEYPMPITGIIPDRDGDGIPDPAENGAWIDDPQNGFDSDGDGLSNFEESTVHHTDPIKIDSDGDGLTDKEEIFIFSTNPLAFKTDPNQPQSDFYMVSGPDSDADGLPDHIEKWYAYRGFGLNSNDPADAKGDLDGDGFSNLHAYLSGWDLVGNLGAYDSDGDGITNAAEDAYPTILNRHNFNDSVVDSDLDGVLNFEEIRYSLDPQDSSTLGAEADLAFLNRTQLLNWAMPVSTGDVDGDGMSNAWEHWYKLNLRSAADATGDPDGDFLINLREFQTWRNPQVKDYNATDTSTSDPDPSTSSLVKPYTHSVIPELGASTAGGSGSFADFSYTKGDDAMDDVIVEVRKYNTAATSGIPGFGGGTSVEAESTEFCQADTGSVVGDPSATTCPCHHHTAGRFKRMLGVIGSRWWLYILDGSLHEEMSMTEEQKADENYMFDHGDPTVENSGWTLDSSVECATYNAIASGLGAPSGSSSGGSGGTAASQTAELRIRINTVWAKKEPLVKKDCVYVEVKTPAGTTISASYADLSIVKGQRVSSPVTKSATDGNTVTLTFDAGDPAPPPANPSPLSASDGAGSRYRKVGLNGMPLPDAKPQAQNENGESDEETYIDAFSSQVRHSVSDVYVTDPALLPPLMIKRDVTSDSWNDRGGLKPEERIAEPFGPCWTSNLSSYIHFDEGSTEADPPIPPSAEVFDEMGSRQRFFLFGSTWVHDLQEGNDVKTRSNLLVSSGNQSGTHSSAGNTISFKAHSFSGLILKKKFGTTCHYEMISPSSLYQVLSPDRIKHEGQAQVRTFARLTKVVDRWGNELHYSYPTNVSLIPSKIFDPIREGHAICIKQDGGRVQQVRAPNGEITEYGYTDSRTLGLAEYGLSGTQLLTQVIKGASQVGYSYSDFHEQENIPTSEPETPAPVTQHRHLELAGITDESGGTYSFHYLTNNRFYFFDGKVRRRQYGLPMILNSVISPPVQRADSPYALQTGTLNIITTRSIDAATGSATFTTPAFYTAFAWTHGIETRTYRYDFTLPKEIRPLKPATFAFPSNPNSITFAFAGMSITAPDTKVETYIFNTATNMALSSATDRNGGKTTFEYGTDGFDDPIKERAWISTTVSYDKLFTYHAATRILESSANPRGVKTLYSIDSLGRRLTETVKHPTNAIPGGHAKTWTFDDTFPGFMTSETSDEVTARTTGNPTTNYPAITKTMAYADPTTGLGWWRKITETISGTSPLIKTTTITDFSGNKRSVTDGRGLTTRFDYDERGRLIRVTHPDSSFKVLDYDAHGNLVIEVDEESVYRFHEYDAWNRRIKSTLDLNGDRNADPRYTSSTVDAQGIRQYNGDLVTETRYNSMNLAVEEIDERSIVTRHTYDSLGRRLTTSVNATNLYASGPRSTAFTYQSATINGGKEVGGSVFDSSSFKPVQITDTRYGLTKFTYDALYRPVTVQSPNLAYVHTTYDKAGNVTSTCDPTTTLAPAKSIITGDLEANQRLTQVDSLSDAFAGVAVTHTFYDALGQPVRVEHPDGNNATTAYTFFGKPYVSKDETGLYTHARYNTAGLPFKTISSPTAVANENPGNVADPFTLTSYDAVGNFISARDPLGNVTETRYDSRNRPYKVIFPEVADALAPGPTAANPIMRRPVTVTEYDALGRATATTDPLGRTSRQFYDPAGRLVRSFDALDQATFMTYDASGKVTSVVNALGQKVTNFYDSFGQLIKTTDAAGIINQFAYDAAGNRTIVSDGLSRSTSFAYDTVSRLTTQTFPNGDDWRYTHNAVNKISQIDPKNVTTAYTYDVRNRLEKAGTRDFIYDVKGRLSKVNDMAVTADKTVDYTYDAYGRTLTEKSVGLIHTNEYDKASNRIAVTYADGRKVSTTYDALKRPSVLVDDNGTPLDSTDNQTTRYGYDLAGRAVQLIAQNGQVTRNDYDELGRLTARTLFRSLTKINDAGRLASFTWTHDAIGNVLTQTEFWFASGAQPARQRATAMTNDAANRLISETITEPGLAQVTTTYSYDAGNNRTTKVVTLGAGTPPPGLEIGHWTCTYNTANQLTRLDKRAAAGGAIMGGATYTYDANGNRLTKIVDGTISVTYRTTNYTWDIFDRLATVAQPVSATLKQTYTYTYDYRTRRTGVARTLAGTSPARHTAVVFSGGLSVLEYDRATNTALTTSTATSVKYTRGPDMGGGVGGLLYTLRNPVNASGLPVAPGNTTPAVRKYNLSNGRGDIVAQSDSTGALTWTASYEAYGKRTRETGTNADKQRANSKDEDPTGLLNEGFRYRDIETGVWLSRDPAGFVDGPNVYCFVKQNPWTAFDPDGLEARPAPSGGYMFVSNKEPGSYVGQQVQHPKAGYNGQCATGAQYVTGTEKKVGKTVKTYDAPSTNSSSGGGPWKKGPSLKDYQPPPGTMIAWGFNSEGRYPSTPEGNHTGLYEGPTDNKGNFTVISQNRRTVPGKTPSPFSRDAENVDTREWHVVVADSRHDPKPSQSSLVRVPESTDYPNLDNPNGPQSAPTPPTDSSRKSESKGFIQRIKETFSRNKKE